MFPRFKYLSEKLFTPKIIDHDKHLGVPDGAQKPRARTHPLAGEVFTTLQASVIDNRTKQDGILISGAPGSTSGGFFTGATNFTMNYPTFIDNSQTTNYIGFGFPVLLTLKDASTPEAALDSAVRHPPPKCHPGSRQTINGRLEKWLLDLYRQRKMTWLYGPAGVGKSAIAQTFGELARDRGCLGAAFFSAFDDLPTDSFRIIPTLAYQLAIRNADYKQVITQQLAVDPSILDAAIPVQFQKLIIEPFSLLTPLDTQHSTNAQPYVIILDGLDECEDENAQCELIELINSAAQRNDLPLIWLLCSRPESHIKYTFSQLEFIRSCDREELVIDDEARADVERFLRETFQEIHARYRFVIAVGVGGAWPPGEAFDRISKAVSGYFVFASAVMRVVGDRIVGDPENQLSALLKMLQGLDDIGMNNPFEALDIFYSRILSRVPERLLQTATLILGICARGEPSDDRGVVSAEWFRLFLQIGKAAFYRSLEKLHSVIRVPPSSDAQDECLSFYHKSFPDYLRKQRRSGKFFLSSARAKVLLGVNSLYWYNHILVSENRDLVEIEEHSQSQTMLEKWSSGDEADYEALMRLASTARSYYSASMRAVTETDTDFFDALCEFNFGLLTRAIDDVFVRSLMKFMHIWNWSKTPTGPHFIRTEVFDETVDHKLLRHLSILTNGKPIPPIDVHEPVFYRRGQPIPWKGPQPNTMGYVIIGRGSKSGLVCCYQEVDDLQMVILNSVTQPTAAQMSRFREWTKKMELLNHPEPGIHQDVSTERSNDGCQNQ